MLKSRFALLIFAFVTFINYLLLKSYLSYIFISYVSALILYHFRLICLNVVEVEEDAIGIMEVETEMDNRETSEDIRMHTMVCNAILKVILDCKG